MTTIEKLLEKYCPDGVEFKEFGEVCEFQYGKGNTIPKDGGDFPVYGCNGIVGKHNEFNNENSPIIGHIGTAGIVVWGEGKHFVTYNGTICRPQNGDLLSKYLYYNLLILNLPSLVKGVQPFLSYGTLKKLKIPIPPIEIQKEIVKILDTFTELEARKKQYEYYRDDLLSFGDDEVEWKSLGKIANYSKTRISSSELNHENYVGVDNLLQNKQGKTISSYVPTSGNLTKYENGDILIGNIRPYLKKIWRADNIGGTNGDVLVIRIKDKELITYEFLYYLLLSESFFNYNMKYAKGAKMPRGDKDSIMKFPIPIPPIEKQQEIVAILDKFDALVNDISVGLPAELKARRQQYEYYRGKLLDFKELEK